MINTLSLDMETPSAGGPLNPSRLHSSIGDSKTLPTALVAGGLLERMLRQVVMIARRTPQSMRIERTRIAKFGLKRRPDVDELLGLDTRADRRVQLSLRPISTR